MNEASSTPNKRLTKIEFEVFFQKSLKFNFSETVEKTIFILSSSISIPSVSNTAKGSILSTFYARFFTDILLPKSHEAEL